ncbi:uncharacterized protein LOC113856020 [Abrus precatorius]|uniref:Uncharacterized protein LOC113856020 n=1 Tax=Abrus precatorius TaxID=3816 RepID=A0A8B8KHZ1_ABRPR|nr:uncharacterized protein LOC113856020 [Abrus precatorius]
MENCECVSNRNTTTWSSYVRIFYNSFMCVDNLMTRLKMPRWRTFWRKIKREKRKLFSSSPVVHVQYDLSSYSQNFDDGYSTDPDNLSRSFSARFAVPSKIFENTTKMRCGSIANLLTEMFFDVSIYFSLSSAFPLHGT